MVFANPANPAVCFVIFWTYAAELSYIHTAVAQSSGSLSCDSAAVSFSGACAAELHTVGDQVLSLSSSSSSSS